MGVVGLALSGIGWFLNPTQFYRSYLLGFMLWNGLALGCMAVAFLHQLSGGVWGAVIRRVLESATRTFPLTLLFFLPLLVGVHSLYTWSNPAVVAADKVHPIDIPFTQAIKVVTQWGTGTRELVAAMKPVVR